MRIVGGGKRLWELRAWSRDIRQFLDDVDAKLASLEAAERQHSLRQRSAVMERAMPVAVDAAIRKGFGGIDTDALLT